MWPFKKKEMPRASQHYKFLRPCSDFDAVVFVHGFNGHYINTWGKFPGLLDGDPDLPAMDILLLGYSTGLGLFHPAIDRSGEVIISDLRLLLPHAPRIVIVCHSMGGVVALSGVRDEMIAGRANTSPVSQIHRFVLFGTPLKSEHLATAAKHLVFGIPYSLRIFNAQIRQLANGQFGHKFESDLVNRIYRPPADSNYARRTPVHVCLGKKDRVVKESEARSVIEDPAPESLEETHGSIKEPESRKDKRYFALKRPVELTAAVWLKSIAPRAIDRTHPQRELAAQEIWDRLEYAMDARLRSVFRDFDAAAPEARDRLRERLLVLSIEFANAADLTVAQALNAGLRKLVRSMRRRR